MIGNHGYTQDFQYVVMFVIYKLEFLQNYDVQCILLLFGGLELVDTYSKHKLDENLYKNKMVLVVGGGNSAYETGDYLSGIAGIVHVAFNKRIQFAWDTHFVGKKRLIGMCNLAY